MPSVKTKKMLDKKAKTARLSIFSNSLLIFLKLITGLVSGSISIISEAIHSTIDLAAAIMAFFSVKVSSIPPDDKHPYGHGKFENISAVIEAVLIFIASGWIIYEAVDKFNKKEPLENLWLAVIVMVISSVVNYIVSKRLYSVAKDTDSVALEADALHLKADVWTSAGVGISMLVIWITGWHILDPIIAILVAIFILREAYFMLNTAISPLLDSALPNEDIELIKNIISSTFPDKVYFHQLRGRKSGFKKFIDLHLEVPGDMTVKESHDICDCIEQQIERILSNSEVSIHVEPLEQKEKAF